MSPGLRRQLPFRSLWSDLGVCRGCGSPRHTARACGRSRGRGPCFRGARGMHSAPEWQEAEGVDARLPCPAGLCPPGSDGAHSARSAPHVAPGLLLGRADTWLVWVWLYRLVKHGPSSCAAWKCGSCPEPAPLRPRSPCQPGTAGSRGRLTLVLRLISRMLEASVSGREMGWALWPQPSLFRVPQGPCASAASREKAPVGFQIPSSCGGPVTR